MELPTCRSFFFLVRRLALIIFLSLILAISSCTQSTSPELPQPISSTLPQSTPTLQIETIPLAQAQANGWVELDFNPLDDEFGKKILLTIRRLTSHGLILTIETASLLLNSNPEQSNLVVRGFSSPQKENTQSGIQLLDENWHEFTLETYSLDFYRSSPTQNTQFTLIEPIPSEVKQILQAAIDVEGLSPNTLQIAIWSITDGINQEDLDNRNLVVDMDQLKLLFKQAKVDIRRKRIFDESIISDPQSYLTRGNKYSEIGEYTQAIADYSDGVELINTDATSTTPEFPSSNASNSTEYLLMELYYRRGMGYLQKLDYQKAILDFQTITTRHSANPLGHYALGVAYSSQPEPDYTEALIELNQAINLAPQFSEAYLSRGLVFAAQGDFNRAIMDFNQAINLSNTLVKAYYARGQAFGALGKFDNAIKDFSQVITLDEGYAEAYRERGISYAALGDKDQAIIDFKMYQNLSPQAQDQKEISRLIISLEGKLPTPSPGETTSLISVVNQNWVKVNAKSLGVTSGDSVRMQIMPLIDQDFTISIPVGTYLLSAIPGQSDMVIRRLRGMVIDEFSFQPTDTILLNQNNNQVYLVEAYSLDYNKLVASEGTDFALAGLAKPEIIKLLESITLVPSAEQDVMSIQTALWVLTNDISSTDLDAVNLHPNLEIVKILLDLSGANLECTKLFGTGTCPFLPQAPSSKSPVNIIELAQLNLTNSSLWHDSNDRTFQVYFSTSNENAVAFSANEKYLMVSGRLVSTQNSDDMHECYTGGASIINNLTCKYDGLCSGDFGNKKGPEQGVLLMSLPDAKTITYISLGTLVSIKMSNAGNALVTQSINDQCKTRIVKLPEGIQFAVDIPAFQRTKFFYDDKFIFSENGKYLLINNYEGISFLYDVNSGQLAHGIKIDWESSIKDNKKYSFEILDFSLVDNMLLAAIKKNDDLLLGTWSLSSGELVNLLSDNSKWNESVKGKYSPNGKTIALYGADNYIQLFTASDGNFIRRLGKHKNYNQLIFSPNGKIIFVSTMYPDEIELWDVESGKHLTVAQSNDMLCWTISPNGEYLATVTKDSIIHLWGIRQ